MLDTLTDIYVPHFAVIVSLFIQGGWVGVGVGGRGGPTKVVYFNLFLFLDAGTKLKVFSAPDKVGF